jgi:hypothetical protein
LYLSTPEFRAAVREQRAAAQEAAKTIKAQEKLERNRARARKWNEDNPEEYKQRMRRWYTANADKVRSDNLLKRYKLTPEMKAAMLAEQGMCCAICGTDKPSDRSGWHVDHCHNTGKVRGLLCHHCNMGLGRFRDDAELLQKAITYLEQNK